MKAVILAAGAGTRMKSALPKVLHKVAGRPLVFWPVVIALVTVLVIRPEERYLAQRFGEAYARYRAEVRRWL